MFSARSPGAVWRINGRDMVPHRGRVVHPREALNRGQGPVANALSGDGCGLSNQGVL